MSPPSSGSDNVNVDGLKVNLCYPAITASHCIRLRLVEPNKQLYLCRVTTGDSPFANPLAKENGAPETFHFQLTVTP
jgi:hypothetical protein